MGSKEGWVSKDFRRQLEGQRDPVEMTADLPHGPHIVGTDGELRPDCPPLNFVLSSSKASEVTCLRSGLAANAATSICLLIRARR